MRRTWISVKRGLLEPKHRERLGPAIWVYLHILDRADWEQGAVLEWTDAGAAEELGMDINTLRNHRRRLEEMGYISAQKKQYSQKVFVHNWTNPREYTGKVYNHQTAKDAALSEKAQSGNQSSNQSGNQPIGELTTPTYSQTSNIKHQTTAAKKPSPRDEIRKFAQTKFQAITKLPVPPNGKEAGTLWWTPLREICDLGQWDTSSIASLISASLAKMREGKLTVSSPKSILKVARSVYAETQGGRFDDRPESATEWDARVFGNRSQ